MFSYQDDVKQGFLVDFHVLLVPLIDVSVATFLLVLDDRVVLVLLTPLDDLNFPAKRLLRTVSRRKTSPTPQSSHFTFRKILAVTLGSGMGASLSPTSARCLTGLISQCVYWVDSETFRPSLEENRKKEKKKEIHLQACS